VRNDPVDPETLAALLDGRLSSEERARVLARLAKSEREYEDLLETAAIVGELTATPSLAAAPAVPPVALVRDSLAPPVPRRRRWLRPALVGPIVIAASLALVVVLRTKTQRAPDASLFAVIESAAGTERVPVDWPRTRGPNDLIAPEALSFRLGVMFADLDLAIAAKDSVSMRAIASDLADLAATIPSAASTVVRTRALAAGGLSGPGSSADERRKLAGNLRTLNAKGAWFDLGAWAQAARHAAHAGRAEFFLPDGPAIAALNRVLGELETSPSSDAIVSGAVQRLRNAKPSSVRTPADVGVMSAVLDSTVTDAGR
jgi:hypothetical protein